MVEREPKVELLLTWLEQEVASKPSLQKGLAGFDATIATTISH
jgi:hypothetical protein